MIAVDSLCIKQGDFELSDLSFTVEKGAYAILMGKTGCGKTTILEAVLGLRNGQSGRIVLQDRDVTHLVTGERGIGYVPQDLALFSTMTVHDHFAFALQIRGWKKPAVQSRVTELARLLDVSHLLHRKPKGLSGGESQRVALGRALSFHPEILLLDEPLSALDESTRHEMYDLLRSVQKRIGVTTLHVTHSWTEAQALGDRILLLNDGRIQDLSPSDAGKAQRKSEPGPRDEHRPAENGSNGEIGGVKPRERKA